MCLDIKKYSFKRKARKNIIVYKQISSYVDDEGKLNYITPYRNSKVKVGETYTSRIYRDSYNRIEEGLHSFATITDCYDNSVYIHNLDYYANGKRFPVKPVLVECIIPKGARYYNGTFDRKFASYASDTLIYNRILGFNL